MVTKIVQCYYSKNWQCYLSCDQWYYQNEALPIKYYFSYDLLTSQKTPILPINTDKLEGIKENMMAIKSIFMNEIYELKKEISLLRSLSVRNENKESENSHTNNILETKLIFLEKKTQFYVRSLKINKK